MGILQASLGGVGSGAQAATFLTALSPIATSNPFPAQVVDSDYAIAYFGPKGGTISSGGSQWTAIAGDTPCAGRRLNAADIASGFSINSVTLLAFYRGPVAAILRLSVAAGVGSTPRLVGNFVRSEKHAGIVAPIHGTARGTEQIGMPLDPAPFVSRVTGRYIISTDTFSLAVYDRLTPPYASGTDITWLPSASNGNAISIIELLNQ